MNGRISISEKADGSERVIVCRRKGSIFSFRRQWADLSVVTGAYPGWGTLGPDIAVYDSSATAELSAVAVSGLSGVEDSEIAWLGVDAIIASAGW